MDGARVTNGSLGGPGLPPEGRCRSDFLDVGMQTDAAGGRCAMGEAARQEPLQGLSARVPKTQSQSGELTP
jgi:hypothetical protein